jgi:hypothetical protein
LYFFFPLPLPHTAFIGRRSAGFVAQKQFGALAVILYEIFLEELSVHLGFAENSLV